MKSLVIEMKAVKSNLQMVKEQAGKALIIADLSGDAYGLGLLETARLLRDGGVSYFGVSEARDAAALRKAGFVSERIMMLRSTTDSEELLELMELDVVCTVGSYDAAVALNGIAEARKTVCEVQIEIDTGMGRYGFSPSETDKVTSIYRYMSNLAIVGMYTSLAESGLSKKAALQQIDAFQDVLDKLNSMGFETGMAHACDSGTLMRYDFGRLDAVRVGTAFSGRIPGKAISGMQKVGHIEAGIEEIGWVPKGHKIGKVILKKAARIAVLSVGYYHGFSVNRTDGEMSVFELIRNRIRSRVRHTYVKIGGQRAKVVGSVGMLHTTIDVTDINCVVGDLAVLDVDPVNVKGLARLYRDA